MHRSLLPCLLVSLVGCVTEVSPDDVPVASEGSLARAPLDGTSDDADRGCNVVLREASRAHDADGSLLVHEAADLPGVCAGPAVLVEDPDAFAPRVRFYEDGSVEQEGGLVEGAFFVDYDHDRLTGCRGRRYGREAWSLTAWALYLPSGKTEHATVVAPNDDYSAMNDVAARFVVPAGTTSVELWFQNNSVWGCNEYDSNGSANYAFDVLAPPTWAGDLSKLLTRSSSAPCAGAVPVDGDVLFDSWARTRAVRTELCFDVWEPGVTDEDDPLLWQKLDVQARFRVGDGVVEASYVPYVGRAGNNARYAFDLRALDPLAWPSCPGDVVEVVEQPWGDLWRAPVDVTFVVNGEEVSGGPVRVVYEDAARAGCD